MALVEYSESDSSDDSNVNSKLPNTKPAFRKVVDRANPHKIRVALPAENTKAAAAADEAEPPRKRARVEPGAGGGFNALLPAPKRTAVDGGQDTKKARVGLKTGATPSFVREVADFEDIDRNGLLENGNKVYSTQGIDEIPHKQPQAAEEEEPTELLGVEVKTEVPKKGNAMIFKPLSVARNKKKKKAPLATVRDSDELPSSKPSHHQPPPRISLFATESTTNPQTSTSSNPPEPYHPIIYHPSPSPPPPSTPPPPPPTTITTTPPPQTLSTIASDLQLSSSATRQLLGRHPAAATAAITVVNFSTDAEYAANELLRQAGEQSQVQAVRALAPGKHSLKQLVSAASSQKEAFEESFAQGRRNRREAGGRYGW